MECNYVITCLNAQAGEWRTSEANVGFYVVHMVYGYPPHYPPRLSTSNEQVMDDLDLQDDIVSVMYTWS
jgi:hypothetical protein